MRSPQHETNLQTQSHHSQAETEDLQPDIHPPISSLIAQLDSAPNPTAHAAMLQRSPANPQAILQLQRQYGNRYVNRVLQQSQSSRSMPIQAKLTLGAVGDKYEQEADRVAKQVVNQINAPAPQSSIQNQPIQREEMPEEDDELMRKPVAETIQQEEMPEEDDELMMKPVASTIQRMEIPEEDDELMMKSMVQRQPIESGEHLIPEIETSIQQARGNGKPLPDTIRQPMEQAFGANFSGVKIHTDAQSDRLNQVVQAKAFTTGQNIFFRQGEYNPESSSGQELLAHELTHVAQQNTGTVLQRQSQQEGVQVEGKLPSDRISFKKMHLDFVRMKRKDTQIARKLMFLLDIGDVADPGGAYGHWWTEIGDKKGNAWSPTESYGWWPQGGVNSLTDTLLGVPGQLNGGQEIDPHHGEEDHLSADFYPVMEVDDEKSDNKEYYESFRENVTQKIQDFAKSYKGNWRWTLGWGQNCRTFQQALKKDVGLHYEKSKFWFKRPFLERPADVKTLEALKKEAKRKEVEAKQEAKD